MEIHTGVIHLFIFILVTLIFLAWQHWFEHCQVSSATAHRSLIVHCLPPELGAYTQPGESTGRPRQVARSHMNDSQTAPSRGAPLRWIFGPKTEGYAFPEDSGGMVDYLSLETYSVSSSVPR